MKIYVGLRNDDGSCSVSVNGQPLDPRLDWQYHNPTGFDWGFQGSGPAQLALAILADYLGQERKELVLLFYQKFKADVVSEFAFSNWELSGEDVRIWLNRKIKVVRVWSYFSSLFKDETDETTPKENSQTLTAEKY